MNKSERILLTILAFSFAGMAMYNQNHDVNMIFLGFILFIAMVVIPAIGLLFRKP
ncbi:hypothetical protein Acj9p249 [Acinetobacter phage Acj9]|uniref:Uncharacterized protein n=1 Tax=Acinetobacter phage Acj9 TaxID=760939 RepID=E5EQ33_9CAUD|nr:hypothetical protein Acj9p249 [Acinetobacter phage Acj9]ADG60149.1 hypothetical protein Acj9p249 [Acinetobacter phage Acj9]